VDGQPRLLSLKEMLDAFLRHRREIVTRRTVYDLRKARERGHILEGLAVALAISMKLSPPSKPRPRRRRRAPPWSAGRGTRAPCRRCWSAPAPSIHGRDGEIVPLGNGAGRLPPDRNPGPSHFGNAPQPAHRAGTGKDCRRVPGAAAADQGSVRHLGAPERLLQVIRAELEGVRETVSPTSGAPRSFPTTKI